MVATTQVVMQGLPSVLQQYQNAYLARRGNTRPNPEPLQSRKQSASLAGVSMAELCSTHCLLGPVTICMPAIQQSAPESMS